MSSLPWAILLPLLRPGETFTSNISILAATVWNKTQLPRKVTMRGLAVMLSNEHIRFALLIVQEDMVQCTVDGSSSVMFSGKA